MARTPADDLASWPFACPPRLLRREHAAGYCQISPSTFDEMVKGGVLPAGVRLAGKDVTRWDRHRLDAALDEVTGAEDPSAYWDRKLKIE